MKNIKKFQRTIWDFYHTNKRDFPWRNTKNPYHIWVSEIMLQQTQTDRVVPKYEVFLRRFPDVHTLATASQKDVLECWQGLGYNRRGLNLKRAAETIVERYNGKIPNTPELLESLPGIGTYTSKAIITFVYNTPLVFIETNIRTVYLNYFFDTRSEQIHDSEIFRLIEKTIDKDNPKEWFYALMDYGAMLKRNHKVRSVQSVHYRKQTPFKGSPREIRSLILKYILKEGLADYSQLCGVPYLKNKIDLIQHKLDELVKEGFLVKKKKYYYIAN